MSKVKDQKFTVLKDKKTVITRAGFWKVPHNTKEDEVFLKVGRYKKTSDWSEKEEPEELNPKSELTLDSDEFQQLIGFLEENYEPFKSGTKAFIPLEKPYDRDTAKQIRKLLNLPDREKMLKFLIGNDVIPQDLEVGLSHARRSRAIDEFNCLLESDHVEPRCTLIYGRSNDWKKDQQEAFRILNTSYHNLTIMTYDHVLDRAKRILGKNC